MSDRTAIAAPVRLSVALTAAAGFTIALLGAIVLAGWLTQSAALVQIIPTFAPMQYNEALGFLLAGVSLLATAAGKRTLTRVSATPLFVLAAITVAQYVTGLDFGIDDLLVEPFIATAAAHPARMAPTTAVGFALAAIALFAGHPRHPVAAGAIAILGVIIACLGALGFAGYLSAVPVTYGWGQLTRTAVLAATGMIVMGSTLFARAWSEAVRTRGESPRWLPIAAGAGGLTTALCIWQSMYALEHQDIARRVNEAAGAWAIRVRLEMERHIAAVDRISARWAVAGPLTESEWTADAAVSLGSGEFAALRRYFADARPPLTVLTPGSAGQDVAAVLDALADSGFARDTSLRILAPRSGDQQGTAVLLLSAVPADSGSAGFVVGAVLVQDLMATALSARFAELYNAQLLDGERTLYRSPTESVASDRWTATLPIELEGAQWTLRVRPTATGIRGMLVGFDEAVLIVGIVLSLLFASVLRFAQEAERRARELATTNRTLSREMANRGVIERALRESEQRYRDLTERSQGYIWIHDLDGRLLTVNPAAAQALGYSADEMLGHSMAEYIDDGMQEALPRYLEYMRRHNDLSGTVEMKTRDGQRRTWSFSNTRYTEDERPIYVLANAQDITRLKETEAELERARDAAVESARMKSEFLANMSHEIRTPLNGVIGMTDLLLTTELHAEQREFTETIRASADSLLTIVNDILDFSKIEAGRLAFESLDFGLRNLVESTIEMFAEPAKRKKIDLACLVYSDVPDALRGDPGRLRQVLTNLIGNAVKFTLAGEVTVRVTMDGETAQHAVIRFSISDTGIGITRDQLQRLFQPFTQADGSTARRFGGTGLGLAISKQLAEGMHGQIGVESQAGVGSTFWFTAQLDKQPADNAADERDVSLSGLRVLIVDDNETNRSILKHYAASWGMQTDEAQSGAEALAMLHDARDAGSPYNLAVMDLMMPGMTGFELARMIKSDSSIAATRLVLMPSFGKRGHASDAREAGISAYLVKPVRQSELHECLIAVVSDRTDPVEPPARLVTRHSLNESSKRVRQRILIAEDNLVNQKVLMAQVSRLGYRADLVNNGEEALAALNRYRYALILMDCQMPKLDGYAATREIRSKQNGGDRVPIIAVTANALQGEREKCKAAGMDDYLSKPVRQEELRAVIERWLPDAVDDPAPPAEHRGDPGIIYKVSNIAGGFALADHTPGFKSAAPPDPWASMRKRVDELRAECGVELLGSLIEMFLSDAAIRLTELKGHIDANNAKGIHDTAHALKGSCLNFGVDHVAAMLQDLEDAGEDEQLEACGPIFTRLELEFRIMRPLLAA